MGSPGAGKTTLARGLGALTGLPVHHLDRVQMLPGWVPKSREEKRRIYEDIAGGARWIVEGQYPEAHAILLQRADLVIWLDFGIAVRLWRLYLRTAREAGRQQSDGPPGCPERPLGKAVPFWRFVWGTRQTARHMPLALLADLPPGLRAAHLRTAAEVRAFLDQVRQ